MWISKDEAHKILDQARIDLLVPYNLICKALVATGDLQGTVRTIDGALREYGDESIYARSRSLQSSGIEERSNGFV